jgi:hypothetical protein
MREKQQLWTTRPYQSEVIEVSNHTSRTSIGKTQENINIDNVVLFAKHEKMELNAKK